MTQKKPWLLPLTLFVAAVCTLTFTALSRPAVVQAHEDDDDKVECKKAPQDVPIALQVPTNECVKVAVVGVGVQIYTCTAGAWVLKAPEANLTKNGTFVGNHFLGPKWEWKDGSKIGAAPNPLKVLAPNPAADIPWLLLTVASEDGAGKLAGVTHVQRLHTSGGVAPTGPCSPEASETRVNYTADYVFYQLRN